MQLPTLDINGPASEVSERWKRWKRTFLYYADGQGLTDANKRRAQLLLLQLRPRAKPLLFTAACRRGFSVNTMENDPLASFMCQNR